jgi:hypothetical protein
MPVTEAQTLAERVIANRHSWKAETLGGEARLDRTRAHNAPHFDDPLSCYPLHS